MADETQFPDLMDRVRAAIADPGAVVARDRGDADRPAESITNWSARAVMVRVVEPMRAEIGRLTASADPAVEATARDLVDLWNRLDDTERLATAGRWFEYLRPVEAGYRRCLIGNHEARLLEVHSLRAEQVSMVRDLLQAVYPGDPMPDRPLDTIWNHLLDQVRTDAERVTAVRHLHREFRIFDTCGHQHTENEDGVDLVEEVGLVCQDGYEYSICLECCTRGGEHQSEECATNHERACWPCSTDKATRHVPSPPSRAHAHGEVPRG